MTDIKSDPTFVAIEIQEQAAFAAFGHRTEFAVFTPVAAFDAYDIGAEVGEQHRAVRSCYESAEIDDSDSFERSWHSAQESYLLRLVYSTRRSGTCLREARA